ncbi:hypothetical protein [Microbispora bryophytorum]|uniref:Uncharacterized protein n=1 Tax=Microbispora bryophytorum TaxID=1460882 RepID=A0A8H9GUB9_9ACTN|nr:hypothetical protein [Microbispora bryophytorum]MBD3135550.1 hypothetical protein [Microbispora bryophytorum]TQS09734.1 hypothetical protein FLX07_01290 [Microbispora bryophytorum]GGN98238.1 hypothetical protein GCM10011574_02620 [Microbispora bryophytorum]
MRIPRLAALCLLAVAACGTRAGTPAAVPTLADSAPVDSVVVDKDQALACGEGEGEGPAQALCDAIATAASPKPASGASARPSPKPSVEQVFNRITEAAYARAEAAPT